MLTAHSPTRHLASAPPPSGFTLEEAVAVGWIAHLYPGWQISPVKGGWIAAHLQPVTTSQRRAGVWPSVGRATVRELAEVLDRMEETLEQGY